MFSRRSIDSIGAVVILVVAAVEFFDVTEAIFAEVTDCLWPWKLVSPLIVIGLPVVLAAFGQAAMVIDREKLGGALIIAGLSAFCIEMGIFAIKGHEIFVLAVPAAGDLLNSAAAHTLLVGESPAPITPESGGVIMLVPNVVTMLGFFGAMTGAFFARYILNPAAFMAEYFSESLQEEMDFVAWVHGGTQVEKDDISSRLFDRKLMAEANTGPIGRLF